MIKILLVEDQTVVRDSLAKLLDGEDDMQVVAQTGNAAEAHELCRRHSPHLALMDVMTEMGASGITAAVELRADFPTLKIIIMTGMPEITFIDSAKKAGVNSFLYKNVKSEEMLSAIRSTMNGYSIFPVAAPAAMPVGFSFSDAELSIIRLVCEAKSRTEIAKELAMSESSVKSAITSILNKTGYDSIMKFALYAVANGYIIPNLGGS
jgi:DNA-binding NarL/FixJ family response regulator